MSGAFVKTEKRGHVWLMGLDRANKRNAFSLKMLHELSEAYAQLEADGDLWCGLLYAEGDHFTGGLDLAEVGPAVESGKGLFPADGIDPLDLFGARRNKPVVCAVQGYCLTIGIELLLASDIRVAAADTKFSQLEVGRGIIPFGGATLRFPQVAGWGNAMRWILTGEFFGAEEALRIGLVQEVVPAGEQFDAGLRLAESVAKRAPLAVQATRRSALMAIEEGPEAAKAELVDTARRTMRTKDASEGVRSFLERREAVFQGE